MNTMMRLQTFLSIISLFFVTEVVAQENSLQSYKWEIAYDALPLINKETSAQNLTIRRFYHSDKRSTALRLQLRAGGKSSEFAVTSDYIYGQVNLGYEWYKPIDKFLLYYGPEIGYFYQYSDTGPYKVNQMYQQYSWSRVLEINGILGCKYILAKHLTIGVESKLSYLFNRTKSERTDYLYNPVTMQTQPSSYFSADNSWQTGDITGLSSISIGFIF
jgi:hypothetical protein